MYKRLFLVAITLWLLTVGGAALLFLQGTTTAGSDGRTAIRLATDERDFVLAEMRAMLTAIQGVTEGLAAGDAAAVARAAATGGIASEHGVPPALMGKLPLSFKEQGMAMHAGFDEIAAAAGRHEAMPALTDHLATQLTRCIACHQTYRFDPTP